MGSVARPLHFQVLGRAPAWNWPDSLRTAGPHGPKVSAELGCANGLRLGVRDPHSERTRRSSRTTRTSTRSSPGGRGLGTRTATVTAPTTAPAPTHTPVRWRRSHLLAIAKPSSG